ncbi:uncharacterized protein EI97DRAFT_414353 [Westerdykella ornata]|uniref:Uncharacterized protein n=1 Tax=Westerdykella ornata TaxID=318751 RepID=A0A6A6JNM3_WESOR|nr:uncharacterized protein EI97DRAFT_414353 [Westerdykella ornata]KAF2278112.1 hypothetical protein EI97DRAFT_414353 [Westerdykella ornata]
MHITELPYEILSKILEEAARANIQEGPTYTYGLSQVQLPLQKASTERYVRGPVPPELLKWDATSAIRLVCWQWHEWALEYALNDVYIRRWKGGERWAELTTRRDKYRLYELIPRPTGTAVYRNPFQTLERTVDTFSKYPQVAAKIKRMWFHGFYTAETDRLIFQSLKNCISLVSVSLPWTTVRHWDAAAWRTLLLGSGKPLRSLELLAVDPTKQQAEDPDNQFDAQSLQSVNFGELRRLKFFGDTTFMPITDRDLYAIARTATRLEEFHLTCISTITIDGVVAVVKASRNTLRVLEHSPRSQDGFWHPHPGSPSDSEHLCELLRSCPKLETLSISLPSVCADLFSDRHVQFGGDNAKFSGDLQVRALHICGHEHGRSTDEATDALEKLLHEARSLVQRRATSVIPRELYIELFFADCIFEPSFSSVHGDFSLAQIASRGQWPQSIEPSGKGPYGSTGLYEKEEEGPFQRINESEFLYGVRRKLLSIST